MLTCFQTSVISSSMFLTAMAANPLSVNLAYGAIKQTIGWTDWAKAAIVPGFVSLLVVPLLLYIICPPTVKSSPDAPKLARERLDKMGTMSANEKIMAGTLLLTVGLWIFGGMLSIDAVTAAILGLSILLITGVVSWKECLAEAVAWDTLTWFAALIAMAGYLNNLLVGWVSRGNCPSVSWSSSTSTPTISLQVGLPTLGLCSRLSCQSPVLLALLHISVQ